MNMEQINNNEILKNKLIQIVLKELLNKNWVLYDKLVIFVNSWKFDTVFFDKFLNWLDNGLNNKWTFTLSYEDNEILDNSLKVYLKWKIHTSAKIYNFIINISDYLNQEVIEKDKDILKNNDKIIAKEWIQQYIIKSIGNVETIEELMKILY